MNLKNLILTPVIILLTGCDEKKLDQTLIDQLWIKTVEITEIDPKTPKPEIVILDEDLYQKILRKDCESKSGRSKENCLADRKELEDSILLKTGKGYESRYGGYMQIDQKILSENCGEYSEKEKRKQCKADKLTQLNAGEVLGRSFLVNDYIEIYHRNILSYLDGWDQYYTCYHLPFSYDEKESFFYGVIAHEMLHVALYKKNIDSDDHHRMMRDKYMDPLLNFISDYKKTDRNGFHRKMTFDCLDAGIAEDEASKRINSRQNSK